MPVTELVYPTYKRDPESLDGLKAHESAIFEAFSEVKGLQAAFRGPVLEEDGAVVDPNSMRSILVLEWDDPASFHTFYPTSDKFKAFVGAIKPFLAAPATPQLFEGEARSILCTSTKVTQLIKAKTGDETEERWKRLENVVTDRMTDQPAFYHANGIEKDGGTFLGLIGWKDLQEYERYGKGKGILEQIAGLSKTQPVQNMLVQLTKIDAKT